MLSFLTLVVFGILSPITLPLSIPALLFSMKVQGWLDSGLHVVCVCVGGGGGRWGGGDLRGEGLIWGRRKKKGVGED